MKRILINIKRFFPNLINVNWLYNITIKHNILIPKISLFLQFNYKQCICQQFRNIKIFFVHYYQVIKQLFNVVTTRVIRTLRERLSMKSVLSLDVSNRKRRCKGWMVAGGQGTGVINFWSARSLSRWNGGSKTG